MEKNEIKKYLYKHKPIATRFAKNDNFSLYDVIINEKYQVMFYVPKSDMGNTDFDETMPAQLLIRWIDETHII